MKLFRGVSLTIFSNDFSEYFGHEGIIDNFHIIIGGTYFYHARTGLIFLIIHVGIFLDSNLDSISGFWVYIDLLVY